VISEIIGAIEGVDDAFGKMISAKVDAGDDYRPNTSYEMTPNLRHNVLAITHMQVVIL
jgi:hypothetical protein